METAGRPRPVLAALRLPIPARAAQLLMTVNPSAEVLARLRTAQGKASDSDLASLEGLNLRGRTLRFADLEESRLYAAALTKVDLRGAFLERAELQGANLRGAQLQGATLRRPSAGREPPRRPSAGRQAPPSCRARPPVGQAAGRGTSKPSCRARTPTQRAGRTLWLAARADLDAHCRARTSIASCRARTSGAHLQGANLHGPICRARTSASRSAGRKPPRADLQGADLRKTHIWQTVFASGDLSLADFRSALFDEPTDQDRARDPGEPRCDSGCGCGRRWLRRIKEGLRRRLRHGGASPALP